MLAEVLWPEEMGLQIDMIDVVAEKLIVKAHGIQEMACCPACQETSSRIHTQYQRCPADLPCVGYTVQLNLKVPRFFCDNTACSRCPTRDFLGNWCTLHAIQPSPCTLKPSF
jgi:transposase